MLSMINRGKLEQPVREEFEHLINRLRGVLGQSFDADGRLLPVVPVGGLVPYAGTTTPDGYLWCDGTDVSRTTYQALFTVIGTAYGVGNGTTTFTLPDLQTPAQPLDYLIFAGA